MAASSAPLSLIFKPAQKSISPLGPTLVFPSTQTSIRRRSYHLNSPDAAKCWRISANNGIFSISVASPVESTQELVSNSGDGVSTIISTLLFIAFIGLSVLTTGVIYIAVTDFLQKRERDKFEKEEAAKKKKSGKRGKARARARAGPRGFGEKIGEDDDSVD